MEGKHLEGITSGYQWQAKYLRGAVIDEVVNGYQYDTSGTWTNYIFHHDALQSVTGLTAHVKKLSSKNNMQNMHFAFS